MKTREPIVSMGDLFNRILRTDDVFPRKDKPKITISFYGHDKRIPGDCFIVMFDGMPVGFIDDGPKASERGCGATLEIGQYWGFCGETDMGQSMPALCVECGGEFKRAPIERT